MNLYDGEYCQEAYNEVKDGGFVAYLMEGSENTNIDTDKAIARILIRRFDDWNGKSYAIPESSIYGNSVTGFLETVREWVDSKQGKLPSGRYYRQGGNYSDSFPSENIKRPNFLRNPYDYLDKTNKEDVMNWMTGKNLPATNKEMYVITDELYEAFDAETKDMTYDEYTYHYDDEIFNNEEIFYDYKIADEYFENMTTQDNLSGEKDRKILADLMNDDEWLEKYEGKWSQQRYRLVPISDQKTAIYKRKDLSTKAMLRFPENTFSKEELKPFKDYLIEGHYEKSNELAEFIRKYPELIEEEDIYRLIYGSGIPTIINNMKYFPKDIMKYTIEEAMSNMRDVTSDFSLDPNGPFNNYYIKNFHKAVRSDSNNTFPIHSYGQNLFDVYYTYLYNSFKFIEGIENYLSPIEKKEIIATIASLILNVKEKIKQSPIFKEMYDEIENGEIVESKNIEAFEDVIKKVSKKIENSVLSLSYKIILDNLVYLNNANNTTKILILEKILSYDSIHLTNKEKIRDILIDMGDEAQALIPTIEKVLKEEKKVMPDPSYRGSIQKAQDSISYLESLLYILKTKK